MNCMVGTKVIGLVATIGIAIMIGFWASRGRYRDAATRVMPAPALTIAGKSLTIS